MLHHFIYRPGACVHGLLLFGRNMPLTTISVVLLLIGNTLTKFLWSPSQIIVT
jgi:hypothetical protein